MTGRSVVVVVSLLIAGPLQTAAVPPRPADPVGRLHAWLSAVDRHQPGTIDTTAAAVARWSSSELFELVGDLSIFLERLDRSRPLKRRQRPSLEAAVERPDNVVDDIRALAEQVLRQGSLDRTLKRAALLHADIAMLLPLDGLSNTSVASQPSSPDEPDGRIIIRTRDGVVLNIEATTRHWQIGRMVLESVAPSPADDHLVNRWYRATIAHQLRNEEIAYARPQLAAALRIFSKDAHLLLYAGAFHETCANARVQAAVRDLTRLPHVKTEVGSPEAELRLAEKFFRRSLDANAELAEARLRLGRVLGTQGRQEEAATEIRRAIPLTRDTQLLYYAELFLGQAEAALGRRAAAREHFDRAAALYPRAQSPRLGLALLARAHGDRPAALNAAKGVFALPPSEADREDPWWTYYTAHVRDADALLAELRRSFLTGAKP